MFTILNKSSFYLSEINVNGEPYVFHKFENKAILFKTEEEAENVANQINQGKEPVNHVRIIELSQ